MPNFDVVVGNPPYQGNAQLHQRFFNLAVESLKSGGEVGFLQPATPYLNKKHNPSKFIHHQLMKDYIKLYETSAWLFNPNMYFTEADIGNILSVTILKRIENSEEISSVIYDFNGKRKIFNNLTLEDVTIHGDEPILVDSIRKKIENYIKLHGSLDELIGIKNGQFLCRLGKIRGDISGRNSQTACNEPFFKNSFFTLVSKTPDLHVFNIDDYDDDISFSITTKTLEEANNIYLYCTTKFVQFALSLLKFTTNNHSGELKMVPTVDFTVSWTDEELFELVGLSCDEISFINSFIGDFYDK